MILAILLSALMGAVLGLLGGGGSVLTVPLLAYGLGLAPKPAIASSLIVVAFTSAAALIPHARAGHVRYRTGLLFSTSAMAGAFLGGRAAAFVKGPTLLFLFAVMMLVTGLAMFRGRRETTERDGQTAPLAAVLALGTAVGALTGLVGAGGGFLIVPALVLFGGLSMRDAVGTSLLVITLNALAGAAGHLGHTKLDVGLIAVVAASAIVGATLSSIFGRRIPGRVLQRLFSVFILLMAAYMLVREWPADFALSGLGGGRWPFWLGGAAIAGLVLALLLWGRQALGVSTGFAELCALPHDRKLRRSWRLYFLIGIIAGGSLGAWVAGGLSPSFATPTLDALMPSSVFKGAWLFVGGILIGFGARRAGGCTSGHGIMGVSLFGRASIIATATFMAAGFAITAVMQAVLGG